MSYIFSRILIVVTCAITTVYCIRTNGDAHKAKTQNVLDSLEQVHQFRLDSIDLYYNEVRLKRSRQLLIGR